MGLVRAKGNMYPFVDYTWNPIKGKCHFQCPYCYVPDTRAKKYYQCKPYLSKKELKTNLGIGNFIFVGSMIDMWHGKIPDKWLSEILQHCQNYKNKYLFQSKNPKRFKTFTNWLPSGVIIGTTIETLSVFDFLGSEFHRNIFYRMKDILAVKKLGYPIMVSIEPIMKFTLSEMLKNMKKLNPEFVVIGADSKKHNLSEPSSEDIQKLIYGLQKFTKVVIKDNLKRLGNFNERAINYF